MVRSGLRVVALDLDPQNALGLHFGLGLHDAFGFAATLHYAADPVAAWRAALRSSASGVSFLPFGHVGLDGANAASMALAERPEQLDAALVDMLSGDDVIVIADMPAGSSPALAAVLRRADLAVVPLLPNPASVAQVPSIEAGRFAGAGALGGFDWTRFRFAINQWDMPGNLTSQIGQGVAQQLAGRMLGVVHFDEAVPEAAAAQRLLSDFAPAARVVQDMTQLAGAILTKIESGRSRSELALEARSKLKRFANDLLHSQSTVAQKVGR